MLAPDALEEDPSRSGRWWWSGGWFAKSGQNWEVLGLTCFNRTFATCWRTQKIIKDKISQLSFRKRLHFHILETRIRKHRSCSLASKFLSELWTKEEGIRLIEGFKPGFFG